MTERLEALVLEKMLTQQDGITHLDFPGSGLTEDTLGAIMRLIDQLLGGDVVNVEWVRRDN